MSPHPIHFDNFKPAIVYTIYIASTPEKVWQALTSAEFSRKYFSGFAVEMEQKLGGTFIVRAPDGALHISGEVFEYDPPKKLTVTWNVNWPDLLEKLGTTLVTYEIQPDSTPRRSASSVLTCRGERFCIRYFRLAFDPMSNGSEIVQAFAARENEPLRSCA